jgi:preprotein translocase subunit SecY
MRIKQFSWANQKSGIGLFDMFTGGAFSKSVSFALELCHISVSIVVQLMELRFPKTQK